jgi:hypothetical protein
VLRVSLVAGDFARFADELEQAVQSVKGTATFSTAEAGLGIEIKFTTAGHADVFGNARSRTSLVPDIRYAKNPPTICDSAASRYPQKPSPR